jgi:hypothetical protein
MDTPAPRLKLRLLICNPKSYGSKNITCKGSISNGTTPRTKEDPYLPQVCSYECKSEAEWQRLTTGISKQIANQNSFHAYAILVDTSLPPGPAARVLLTANGLYEPIAPEEALVDAPEPSEEVQQWVNEKIREVLLGKPAGADVEIVSTSQEGSEPVEAHNLDEVGATPTPATNPQVEERVEFIAAKICSDVEQYNDGRFCNAATEYRFQEWLTSDCHPEQPETTPEPIAEPEPETAPVEPEEKPLYAAAWDQLESPMRLKDLAAALEVDADKLKTSLQEPESAVELGHAGWVKRREPKA